MGGAKRAWEEANQRGWKSMGEKFVCAECLQDTDLAKFIEDNAEALECSYCERLGDFPIATALDDILRLIGESISHEWTDPAGELPYDGREGGYQAGAVVDGYDLFFEGHVDLEHESESLLEDIAVAFSDEQFCRRDWAGDSENEILSGAWWRFMVIVSNRRRFFFEIEDEDGVLDEPWLQSVSPAKILEDVGKLVQFLGLIQPLKQGTRLVRARVHDHGKAPVTASELGSPPVECARFPTRMCPAGIVMFYGASNEATAQAETVQDPAVLPDAITFGTFETARDALVLDLVDLPPVPGLFSPRRRLRDKIGFLHSFEDSLTRSVSKDGGVHVDYVPTQVVAEFFRYVFKTDGGDRLFGIRYRSSQNGGPCHVLFVENDGCVEQVAAWRDAPRAHLGLIESSVRTVALK